MGLSLFSKSACLGVNASTKSTGVDMDHLKTVESYFLIQKILTSCLKHGRMEELYLNIVQDAREVFLESMTTSLCVL